MLFSGFLALCQMLLLPGLICIRLLRLSLSGTLAWLVYAFALSLLANHYLVLGLAAIHLYTKPVFLGLIAVELTALAFLYRDRLIGPVAEFKSLWSTLVSPTLTGRGDAWHRPGDAWRRPYSVQESAQIILTLAILLPALAGLASFTQLFINNFGTVFHHWDDFVSWNRWAITWAQTQAVRDSTYYPQLIPANWSLTYLLIGDRDIPMFAKAMMPLFPLAIMLLFFDMYSKTRKALWLVGATCFTLALRYFWNDDIIGSGLVEIPTAFFTFLAFHAALQLDPNPRKNTLIENTLPIVFASGAALTKQGALYFLACAMIWYLVREAKAGGKKLWQRLALGPALFLCLNSWYVIKQINVSMGWETNPLLHHLTETMHAGRTYPERWWHAIDMLQSLQHALIRPFFWMFVGLAALALLHRQGRIVLVTLVIPFYVIWAFLFSYDPRGMVLELPLLAFCCGCGVQVIVEPFATAFGFKSGSQDTIRRARIVAPIALVAVAASAFIIFMAMAPDHSLKRSITYIAASDWWGSLFSTWLKFVPLMLLPLLIPSFSLKLAARIHPIVLSICVVLSVVLLQTFAFPDQKVIAMNLSELKKASDARLNEKLYALEEKGVLQGVVITDYLALEQLPMLRQHFRVNGLALPPSVDNLKSVAAFGNPTPSFMLFRSEFFNEKSDEWLRKNGYKILFDKVGTYRWRLVQSPGVYTSGLKQAM